MDFRGAGTGAGLRSGHLLLPPHRTARRRRGLDHSNSDGAITYSSVLSGELQTVGRSPQRHAEACATETLAGLLRRSDDLLFPRQFAMYGIQHPVHEKDRLLI